MTGKRLPPDPPPDVAVTIDRARTAAEGWRRCLRNRRWMTAAGAAVGAVAGWLAQWLT